MSLDKLLLEIDDSPIELGENEKTTIINTPFEIKFDVKEIVSVDEKGLMTLKGKAFKYNNYDGLTHNSSNIYGHIKNVYRGDTITAVAEYRLGKFGYYIALLNNIKIAIPKLEKDIVSFINKRVNGVGKSLIEDAFRVIGKNLISVIIDDPVQLTKVPELTEKKIFKLHSTLKNLRVYEDLLVFIQTLGLQSGIASEIFDLFGMDSLIKVKNNPYCIVFAKSADFNMADIIANKLGFLANNPKRLRCAIFSYLDDLTDSVGDICHKLDGVAQGTTAYLDRYGVINDARLTEEVMLDMINTIVKNLMFHGKLKKEINRDGIEVVYTKTMYDVEIECTNSLAYYIIDKYSSLGISEKSVANYFERKAGNGVKFAEQQKAAIEMALKYKFSILSGGPGTGKTFVVKSIVECISKTRPHTTFRLLAPTGMASSRVSELTGLPATTIHKALNIGVDSFNGKESLIEEDYLIIDESSMIDIFVFQKILAKVSPTTHILLVGDYEQLPSVGPGLILRDLINSQKFPVTVLNQIFRQASGSNIILNSKKILNRIGVSHEDGIVSSKQKGSDFVIYGEKTVAACAEKCIRAYCKFVITLGNPIQDCVLLSPVKQGPLGTEELNRSIQSLVNPKAPEKNFVELEGRIIREGDKVINLKNDNELKIMNGYVGIVNRIEGDARLGFIVVQFKEHPEEVVIPSDKFDQIDLAYAITVHKSQGNEYPLVIMPMINNNFHMLSRELVNTAWTRAKKMVICVTLDGENVIDRVAKESVDISRLSCLIDRLLEIK